MSSNFHERSGQSLWDNPVLRNLFKTLKTKEIAQANQRKAQRETYFAQKKAQRA